MMRRRWTRTNPARRIARKMRRRGGWIALTDAALIASAVGLR